MQSQRGSLWKKWDLHVHTPYSLVQWYGENNNTTWEKFLQDLESLPENIKVLGINDYIFIDGYRRLLDDRRSGRLKNIELLLPIIELRINKFGGTESKLSRVNFHAIFSDLISPDEIQSQFINSLTNQYELTPRYGSIHSTWRASPTRQSIEDLGNLIIQSVPEVERPKFSSPIIEGFNNLNFDIKAIREILDKHCFKGKYLTGIGKTEYWNIKWNDNSIADKKDIINSVNFVFTAASDPSECKKSYEALCEAQVNNRLLDCSDAHHYSNSTDKDRIGNCFTWIKADTSFLGLQFALTEYYDRVFIGDEPEIIKRVKANGSKYFDKLTINKNPNSNLRELWFDNSLEFNHGLVAIIGNRGSGKSALSETIGLIGNTIHSNDFSFLQDLKFRKKSDNKAKEFTAVLTLANGQTISKNLAEPTIPNSPELVQFIPQNFLEKICNEVPSGEENDFSKELKRVIFSHIDISERLGYNDLDSLLQSVTSSTEESIDLIRNEINSLNSDIINYENELSEDYKQNLQNQLKLKWQQLKDLRRVRPKVIKPIGTEQTQEVTTAIASLNDEINLVENKIKQDESIIAQQNIWLNHIMRFEESVQTYERAFNNLKEQYKSNIAEMGLDIDDIIKFIFASFITKLKTEEIKNRLQLSINEIDANKKDSLPDKIIELRKKIQVLQERLNEPQKLYQDSLDARNAWRQVRKQIIGDKQTQDTLIFLRYELKELSNVPVKLGLLKETRNRKCEEIYTLLKKLVIEYKRLYTGIQDFIDRQIAAKEIKINLSVMLIQDAFETTFLDYFNRRISSSFSPISEGDKLVKDSLALCNFDFKENAFAFIESMDKYMHFNIHYNPPQSVDIDSLMRKGKSRLELYNYLYGLTYIMPWYMLKFGSKQLHELSPGEKGTILMIFYLLVDKTETPLVIDQPEDNLDNLTVVKILVNCIKRTKQKRQIFIVTHNPNLAVVCDAEQIISCSIDKEHGDKVTYLGGSIENPSINPDVVNILEGTKPAFDNRGMKYFKDV